MLLVPWGDLTSQIWLHMYIEKTTTIFKNNKSTLNNIDPSVIDAAGIIKKAFVMHTILLVIIAFTSTQNAQDKCHHYCKTENAEKSMFWNTREKIFIWRASSGGGRLIIWLFLPCVRCYYTLHPQQPNDKKVRISSLNTTSRS